MYNLWDLTIAKFQIKLIAKDELHLPEYKGSTLRGGFGSTLKKVCCIQKQKYCPKCLLKDKCAYYFIFESSPASNSEKLKNLQEIPRPFVIEPPQTKKTQYFPGDELMFNLILFGKAIEYLPYMIYTFIELGNKGIGKYRGQFKVKEVINHTGDIIYDGDSETLYNKKSVMKIVFPEINISNRLKISFLTPTRIKYQGHFCNRPEFHILMRALLRRISSLMYFYCGKELKVDFKNLILQSENVKIVDSNLFWVDWERYSSRQGDKMKLGGIVGRVEYYGDVNPFFQILKAGEILHIGKGTSFGLGKYEII